MEKLIRIFGIAGLVVLLTMNVAFGQTKGKSEDDVIKSLPSINQIPLLDNRFRIDFHVDEITLLFFRKEGTPAVVLVQPDGSKLYALDDIRPEISWFDEQTYDLITIKNPMKGPWQAVGSIINKSKILVVTNLELHVDPLPDILIAGETIKLTAYITNNGKKIDEPNFRDVVSMVVDFTSTNKKGMDNFGIGRVEVAEFFDDGMGFDEFPQDGMFTGEFKLSFSAGEWTPKYHLITPLYSRVMEQDPILLHRVPFQIQEALGEGDNPHQVTIKHIGDLVKQDTVLFQGKLYFPSGEIQRIALTEKAPGPKVFDVMSDEPGEYRIELSAFGENKNGREFMIDIPEYRFRVDPPALTSVPTITTGEAATIGADGAEIAADVMEAGEKATAEEGASPAEEEKKSFPWGLVIVINLVIMIVGGILIWFFLFRKPGEKKASPPKKGKKEKKAVAEEKKEAKKEEPKDEKNSSSDDILDLSMPDE
ncbi:TIGR03503 family protein [Algicola sagamiensis]|uniref:TIGR03503 family protein n=1 Tax=Algicola sagamiensis TaxID=163869 RepID=UPI0003688275|nr:TIGR03503 family protein [Algicola sagamiensis]